MKSLALFAFALLAAVAQAVQFTNSAFDVKGGSTFTITWSGASGPVTIRLKNGSPQDLKTVDTIVSGATGTSFTWSVPTTLPSDTYALEIVDSTNVPNYSVQFQYVGTGTPTTSASTASLTTSTRSLSTTSASTTSSASLTTSASTTTTTSSRTSTSATAATTTTVPGAAGRVSSPLALILVTIAAMLYFH